MGRGAERADQIVQGGGGVSPYMHVLCLNKHGPVCFFSGSKMTPSVQRLGLLTIYNLISCTMGNSTPQSLMLLSVPCPSAGTEHGTTGNSCHTESVKGPNKDSRLKKKLRLIN